MRALAALVFLPGAALAQTQSAVLEPARFVEVRSVIEGRIAELPVAEGQRVAAGDLLAAIDASVQGKRVELARVMAEATGGMDKSMSALDLARKVSGRVAAAARNGAAQPWEVERAEQAVAVAEADRQIALEEHARSTAQLALEEAIRAEFDIRAPFDATVLQVFKEVGAIATTEEDVIMEIGDLETLKATMFVPVEDAAGLAVGDVLAARYGDGPDRTVEATVTVLDPRMDPVSRTVRVVVEAPNPDHELRVGTTLEVDLR